MYRLMVFALLAGCGSEETGFDPVDFEMGTFQMTTTGVNDACFDGGFEVIFMPEGEGEPWGTTTELPGWSSLPSTYNISLQAPFDEMEVTVEAGSYEGELLMSNGVQAGIELDADAYPGCYVDVSVTATLNIIDANSVQGSAMLTTSSFDEDSCAAVLSDPCDIALDLSAVRQ